MSREHKTKYALLGALSVRPMSGYDIKKWIDEVTNPFWSESSGQLYPTLAELLQQRLIQYAKDQQVTNNRQKKIYCITKKGSYTLTKWLALPAEPAMERNELRLKLFYGKHMPIKACLAHIERLKHQMKEHLIKFNWIKDNIKPKAGQKFNEHATFWLLTLRSGIRHARAELAWCEDVLKALNQLKMIRNYPDHA